MSTVHFLYRSIKSKAYLEVRLQYTIQHPDFFVIRRKVNRKTKEVKEDTEYFTNYIWTAKTKIEVTKDDWKDYHNKNSRDVEVKNKIKDLDNLFTPIENHIFDSFKTTVTKLITKDWLQTQINNYYSPPVEEIKEQIPVELVPYMDFYVKRKTDISVNTVRKLKVIQKLIGRYQSTLNDSILIENVNEDFKSNFEAYCVLNKYAPNTIATAFKFIKAVCNHAGYNGNKISPQLKGVSKPFVSKDVLHLNFAELELIEKIPRDKLTDSLDSARDLLLISAYTGQRLSDFMRFVPEMITGNNINFTQKKTGKNMTIALHPKVIEILNKRNGNFPDPISDQKYNDYIKLVCEIAELTQKIKGTMKVETAPKSKTYRNKTGMYRKCDLVSSHIGRRSYATNFYEIMPAYLVMNNTGHTTEQQLLTYLKVDSKAKANETHRFYKSID